MIEDVPLVLTSPMYLEDSDCGYCHGKKTEGYALESMKDGGEKYKSASIYSSVEIMTCKHYDELINQGFRRSGTLLYKKDLLRSCCRLYTIRTNLQMMKLEKKQRKIVNRFIKEIYQPLEHDNKTFDIFKLIFSEQKSSRFYTRYEPSVLTDEKYQLYKKYQMAVHNDEPNECSQSQFKRFLCDTPFPEQEVDGTSQQWQFLNNWVKNWKKDENSDQSTIKRIGPTHECWYLDGKLIAISVLDFLPSGVSSIYFIWDPDYSHLSLGSISSIREILMCDQLNLGYYYLGYYIEDCPKMKYKAKFGGEILDLCNEVYFPLSIVKPFIKNDKLFVIDECTDPDNKSQNDEFQELEIENNGHPIDYIDSDYNGKPLRNVAENIYGKNSPIFPIAKAVNQSLQQHIQLISSIPKSLNFPEVVPGIIPLWQLAEYLENGTIDNDLPVEIFLRYKNEMIQSTLGQLDPFNKKVVLDCIRIFGLDKFQQSIIII